MTIRALKLDGDNNLVRLAGRLVRVADGDAVVQAIRLSLQTFWGEWFLDLKAGLPYWEEILVKNPDLAQIRKRFADRILSVPGVLAIDSLTLDFNRTERTLDVTFKVSTDVTELASEGSVSLRAA